MSKHDKLEFFKQTKDSQHPIALSFGSIDSEGDSIRIEHPITIEEANLMLEELNFIINKTRIEIGLETDKLVDLRHFFTLEEYMKMKFDIKKLIE